VPFDPYFTHDGARRFTCLGQPRAVYDAQEQAEANRLLALPEGEQAKLNLDIVEKRRAHVPVTRPELLFHHTRRKRAYAQRHLPPQLVHRAEADAALSQRSHAHA